MVPIPTWVETAADRSAIVTTARAALGSSRLATGLRKIARDPVLLVSVRLRSRRVRRWIEASAIGGVAITATSRLDDAVDHADVTTWVETVIEAVEASFLFTWLTAEPEPDVVIIDLRDTLSVGPPLALLDATLEVLLPATGYSVLVRIGQRATDVIHDTPIRVASFVVLGATASYLMVAALFADLSELEVIACLGVVLLAAVGTRIRTSWRGLVESKPVQLLVVALAPPAPPERGAGPEGSTAGDRPPERESDD